MQRRPLPRRGDLFDGNLGAARLHIRGTLSPFRNGLPGTHDLGRRRLAQRRPPRPRPKRPRRRRRTPPRRPTGEEREGQQIAEHGEAPHLRLRGADDGHVLMPRRLIHGTSRPFHRCASVVRSCLLAARGVESRRLTLLCRFGSAFAPELGRLLCPQRCRGSHVPRHEEHDMQQGARNSEAHHDRAPAQIQVLVEHEDEQKNNR
mmetsp:Transcript_108987/g.347965  ORF Transcript_108987/g.347965 Transcript_108987/m.347965 type:complete len:204 (+) Transcript_108987:725-1336(+)